MPEDMLNTDTALGYLRYEHARIEELLSTCLESADAELTRQAMLPLIKELDAHTAIEAEYFFPFIVDYVREPDEFDKAVRFSSEIDMLKDRLRSLDPDDSDYYPTLSELASKFERHCYLEEEYGSQAVEMNDPDTHNLLIEIANLMKKRREQIVERPGDADDVNQIASLQARREHREALLEDADAETLDAADSDENRPLRGS
jgi:hypothetical protein